MGKSKIVYGGETLIDLTGDSVTPQTLPVGETAHNAAGEPIEGAMVIAPIDEEPTEGSGNAVSSGGVWSALKEVGGDGTIDTEVIESSPNAVSGGAVYAALNGLRVGVKSCIITESQTFDLSTLGIRVGDEITVICIGGGGGGGADGGKGGAGGAAGTSDDNGRGGAPGAGYGAGGGGGGSSDRGDGGGGGGGSGYKTKALITVSDLSVAVTIGAAGTGGATLGKNHDGGSGGTTSFGAYLSASGGSGGGEGGYSAGAGGDGGNPGNSGGNPDASGVSTNYGNGGDGGDGYDADFFDAVVATGATISGAGCVMIFWHGISAD